MNCLSIAVQSDDWYGMMNFLFGDHPLYPEYYQACLTKDIKTAKRLIKQGAFLENSYLWKDSDYFYCKCRMEGCKRSPLRNNPLYFLSQRKRRYIKTVIDLGLLDPEDVRFIRKCINEN